jgi:hypothetical protein
VEFFQTMGRALYDAWRAKDWDEDVFADLAVAALEARPPSAHVSLLDVVRWIHTSPETGRQNAAHQVFADPDIRVFQSDRFYIEVLCWVDGTTSIHQHSFAGAFHVMAGSSIHSRHTFQRARRYNDSLMTGALKLEDVELLKVGQTRPIHAGDDLIHALFHLERPSISVVVRTFGRSTAGPQYKYYRPALAIDPFFETPAVRKRIQTLGLLLRIQEPSFDVLARDWIREADADTATHMMLGLMPQMEPYTRFRALLESVRPNHPELVSVMLDVEAEQRRERNIILRRMQIKDPEHRFLLALLLNVPTRRQILDLVQAAFPDRKPIDTVLDWIRTLARTKLAGTDESLVSVELDDGALDVLRHMLSGANDAQVLEGLAKEYSKEEVDRMREIVLELCAAFRESLLFKPLLAD